MFYYQSSYGARSDISTRADLPLFHAQHFFPSSQLLIPIPVRDGDGMGVGGGA